MAYNFITEIFCFKIMQLYPSLLTLYAVARVARFHPIVIRLAFPPEAVVLIEMDFSSISHALQ